MLQKVSQKIKNTQFSTIQQRCDLHAHKCGIHRNDIIVAMVTYYLTFNLIHFSFLLNGILCTLTCNRDINGPRNNRKQFYSFRCVPFKSHPYRINATVLNL